MLRVESYKKGIVFSTFFNILNKGLVFCNGLLVAYFFGVYESTDLFFYVYNSVLILGAYFSSMNGTVLIPEAMRLRTVESEEAGMRFINFFLAGYTVIAVVAVSLIFIDPTSFFSAVSNFDIQHLSQNKHLLYLSLPLFALICIINLLIDVLTSHKFFTIPMIVGIINGVVSILFVVIFHSTLGISSVFYGLLISYSANLILLTTLLKRKLGWHFTRITVVKNKRIWSNYGFAQLGNITSTLASYTPMYILTGYSTGIITALTFAQQISTLPTTLITYQFSSVAGIKFNELYAKKETGEINRVFSDSAKFLHFLMVPLSCFIFYFADEIVQFLLGFTSMHQNAANHVALFLRYLGFLLPLFVINSLLSRLFMASHKIKQSFWYQVVFNLLLIAGMFVAVKNMGPVGYPVAMVAAYGLNLVVCYFLIQRFFRFSGYLQIIRNLAMLLLVNIIIAFLVNYAVTLAGVAEPVISLIFAATLYLIILLVMNKMFRLNELVTLHAGDIVNKILNYGPTRSGR